MKVSGKFWVVKFTQSGTDRDVLLAINEGGADFGLGGWGHDIAHDFEDLEDGRIGSGVGLGRPDVLTVLPEVAFDDGKVKWKMIAD